MYFGIYFTFVCRTYIYLQNINYFRRNNFHKVVANLNWLLYQLYRFGRARDANFRTMSLCEVN